MNRYDAWAFLLVVCLLFACLLVALALGCASAPPQPTGTVYTVIDCEIVDLATGERRPC